MVYKIAYPALISLMLSVVAAKSRSMQAKEIFDILGHKEFMSYFEADFNGGMGFLKFLLKRIMNLNFQIPRLPWTRTCTPVKRQTIGQKLPVTLEYSWPNFDK